MARPRKVPAVYSEQIRALQQILKLISVDKRLTPSEFRELSDSMRRATAVLNDVPSRPIPETV